jgi:2-polyprenyl-3-methyl-5-hydroxy-6-metoxy-1,4-benzoquinol methylase
MTRVTSADATVPSPVASSAMTPDALASAARRVFRRGPALVRTLQHYRPHICPFEILLPYVPVGARLLDIGCGGGLLAALVAETRAPARLVGFDSSRDAIEMARSNLEFFPPGSPAPEFHRLDVGAPWPVGPFDCVTIIDVVHHIPPSFQRGVMEQAMSAVAPGGTLIYKDMTRRGIVRPLMNRLHDLALARQWIHYADPENVKAWMREAGMSLAHESFHTRLWYGHELLVFVKP